MVSPPQPWPRPSPFDDRLSEIVARGSVDEARRYFDEAFWENSLDRPGWQHLRIALLREDSAMIRLLATWGAHPAENDMAELRGLARDKYAHYLRLLRQGGLRSDGQPWEDIAPAATPASESADFVIKSFVDGEFVDHRIGKMPEDWRRVLRGFHAAGAEEAVIAGGALRDLFNGRPVKDVDIFLRAQGGERKNRKFLKQAFARAGLEVHEQEFRYDDGGYGVSVRHEQFPSPKTERDAAFNAAAMKRERRMESWKIIAGKDKTEYNVIFVDDSLDRLLVKQQGADGDRKSIFAGGLLDAFDAGLCQIGTDGREVFSTKAYDEDVKHKRITLTRPNYTTEDHLRRIIAKYPDWEQSETTQEFLKPKPRQTVTRYRISTWY